ncbi:MAG: 1-deoxy-D-xylulose-5-phosphate synthase, partial [Clostridia bacterium]|nr:1-deoxy-D-xylulose-5-phosphate synthase [Clostridia bacterium]
MSGILKSIASPSQLKDLTLNQKKELAGEIRTIIIETVSENGGHLASNLGAVELTIALHSVLNAPEDKLIFDVGHQCYTHKLLTGRYEKFGTLRQKGGISGFTRPTESEYDLVASGHASDSISLASGFARARDLKNEKYNVAVVLGDGALTGGMCFEALNDVGQNRERMLIVLNDNEMSISKNVGSMSKYLTHMRQSSFYRGFKQFLRGSLERLPKGGEKMKRYLTKIKDSLKALLVNDTFFDALDVDYLGPIDGHDIKEMERVFKTALNYDRPVVVHVVTKKGKGYPPAEENPSAFHGVSPKAEKTGKLAGSGKAAA